MRRPTSNRHADTDTDRTVDELSGGFEAAVSFAEQCRVLVDDGLDKDAFEFVEAGKALYKKAMYALVEREREGTGPVQ